MVQQLFEQERRSQVGILMPEATFDCEAALHEEEQPGFETVTAKPRPNLRNLVPAVMNSIRRRKTSSFPEGTCVAYPFLRGQQLGL